MPATLYHTTSSYAASSILEHGFLSTRAHFSTVPYRDVIVSDLFAYRSLYGILYEGGNANPPETRQQVLEAVFDEDIDEIDLRPRFHSLQPVIAQANFVNANATLRLLSEEEADDLRSFWSTPRTALEKTGYGLALARANRDFHPPAYEANTALTEEAVLDVLDRAEVEEDEHRPRFDTHSQALTAIPRTTRMPRRLLHGVRHAGDRAFLIGLMNDNGYAPMFHI